MPPVDRPNRVKVSLKVMISGVDSQGVPFEIEVASNNVSRGGLSFTTELQLAMSAEFQIVVRRPPIGSREFAPLVTQGKVVRLAPSRTGAGYDVGLEFTGPHLRMFNTETSA